jgi:tetratricopeptide (TPR) repeat protein
MSTRYVAPLIASTLCAAIAGCTPQPNKAPEPQLARVSVEAQKDAFELYRAIRFRDAEGPDFEREIPGVLALLDRASLHDPRMVAPLTRKGRLLLELGRLEEADECFTRAGQLNEYWFDAYLGKADVLIRIGGDLAEIERYLHSTEICLDGARSPTTLRERIDQSPLSGSERSASIQAQIAMDAKWRDDALPSEDPGARGAWYARADVAFRRAMIRQGEAAFDYPAFLSRFPSYFPAILGWARQARAARDASRVWDLVDPYARDPASYPLIANRKELLSLRAWAAFEKYAVAAQPSAGSELGFLLAAIDSYLRIVERHPADAPAWLQLALARYAWARAAKSTDFRGVSEALDGFDRALGYHQGSAREELAAEGRALRAELVPQGSNR